jgi:hypothetical protein
MLLEEKFAFRPSLKVASILTETVLSPYTGPLASMPVTVIESAPAS